MNVNLRLRVAFRSLGSETQQPALVLSTVSPLHAVQNVVNVVNTV